jgi:hypothetical protein
MNVPMNRQMTVTLTQTAPTLQVHTTASVAAAFQEMGKTAQEYIENNFYHCHFYHLKITSITSIT